jgi:D-alanyl-D-alanine carboxypeptidase
MSKKKKKRLNIKKFILFLLTLSVIIGASIFGVKKLQGYLQAKALAKAEQEAAERAEREAREQAEKERQEAEAKAREEEKLKANAKAAYSFAKENGYLVLINKENSVNKDYKADDLTKINSSFVCSDRPDSTHYLRADAAIAFEKMIQAAKNDGFEIKMTTGYRSYSYQDVLYNSYVKKHGQKEADRFSAKAGTSEHHSGLAADLSAASVNWKLTQDFGESEEGNWIAEHCAEYGFILRYPKDNSEERTGYIYEPWHVRYVSVPVAKEIMNEGLVLEEYLKKYKE